MNSYEQKQVNRKEYYENKAAKLKAESIAASEAATRSVADIPFGQPILTDHYSASKHRSLLKRCDSNMRKSIEADEKAEYYENKAESVGAGGISADDPDAIKKLKEKLAKLEKANKTAKLAVKVLRQKDYKALEQLGFSEAEIDEFKSPNPSYSFKLNYHTTKIRNTKKRILALEKRKELQTLEPIINSFTGLNIVRDFKDNRVRLIFEDIPSLEVRNAIKSRGFRWSKFNNAWQRQLTNNALFTIKCLLKKELKEYNI